jgi:ribosome-binding protein aMBF1 (putative translation factor)
MRYVPYSSMERQTAVGTKFRDLLKDIEDEARAEGPAAVAELTGFDERYRLARELMTRRRQKGLTQTGLAKLTGIGQADISRIESGRANPTVGTLVTLAHALGFGISLVPLKGQRAISAPVRRSSKPHPTLSRNTPAPA